MIKIESTEVGGRELEDIFEKYQMSNSVANLFQSLDANKYAIGTILDIAKVIHILDKEGLNYVI